MIFVAEEVVHEDAVMVELLNTLIAKVTVVRILGSQVLTVDTDVIEVILFLDQLLQKLLKISRGFDIARVSKDSQHIKDYRSCEKDTCHYIPEFEPVASMSL